VNPEAVYLKLTQDLSFSMTDFDKVNKGMTNSNINCFMNVCLQSLIACPAFFNMLTLVSENADLHHDTLRKNKDVLAKFVALSRYFEPKIQIMDNAVNKFQETSLSMYQDKVVDAEAIFAAELAEFNPEMVQADCSEFLSYILDKLHEEMKDIYVSNAANNEEQKDNAGGDKGQDMEWKETGENNAQITYNNQEDLQTI
jgi:ubiquitin C-terminal hydrolase